MTQGIKTFLDLVRDAAHTKSFYRKLLGVEPHCHEPYYDSAGLSALLGCIHVAYIQKTLRSLLGSGAAIEQDIKNDGGGRRDSVKDADGNVIGLLESAA